MCIPEGTLRAYLDDQLDAVGREAVAAHLRDCERCRAIASLTAERRDRVQQLIEGTVPVSNAPRPAAAVLAQLRLRLDAAPQVSPIGLVLRLSLAAAVVAVAFLGLWTTMQGGRTAPVPARGSDSARLVAPGVTGASQPTAHGRAEPYPGASTATPQQAVHLVASERLIRAAAPPNSARRRVERYVLSEDEIGTPDVGMVVRVKVPVSFPAIGNAVGDSGRLYQELEADVLVTQDGRPYAIWLIQDSRTPGRK